VSASTLVPQRSLSAAPPALEPDEDDLHVLVVDDEPTLRSSLVRMLSAKGMRVGGVEDGQSALDYLAREQPDVALLDMMLPDMRGLDLLQRLRERRPDLQFIMMTAHADVNAAVDSMRMGAYHFLTKPFHSNDAVAHAVAKAAEHRRLLLRAQKLEERLLSQARFGEIIGTSPKMASVYKLIDGVAAATSTVLIRGESGTGKELVARAIHQNSARAAKAFVPVNCAAIPRELVESELFGHVRGAFTGAQTARAGLFETAHQGTILLDEVGDLPLAAQVKLLRTLQEGEIKRVGSDETRYVDVRVLAATNVDLVSKIADGAFRRDLFYRLNVIQIVLPPLRERGEDVMMLTHHFLQKFAARMQRTLKKLSPEAARLLRSYPFPGNVRELEHAIEHAVVLSSGDWIEAPDLPFFAEAEHAPVPAVSETRAVAAAIDASHYAELPYAEAKRRILTAFDDGYTAELLRRADGNLSEAARLAGLDRSNFRRIIKRKA
jgi:DNA-binding NtrC family response regulator